MLSRAIILISQVTQSQRTIRCCDQERQIKFAFHDLVNANHDWTRLVPRVPPVLLHVPIIGSLGARDPRHLQLPVCVLNVVCFVPLLKSEKFVELPWVSCKSEALSGNLVLFKPTQRNRETLY